MVSIEAMLQKRFGSAHNRDSFSLCLESFTASKIVRVLNRYINNRPDSVYARRITSAASSLFLIQNLNEIGMLRGLVAEELRKIINNTHTTLLTNYVAIR